MVVDTGSSDGTATGGGMYVFHSQRRTLHDTAGPFNDASCFGLCDAGPGGTCLGADAPAHCGTDGQDLWPGCVRADRGDPLHVQRGAWGTQAVARVGLGTQGGPSLL